MFAAERSVVSCVGLSHQRGLSNKSRENKLQTLHAELEDDSVPGKNTPDSKELREKKKHET